MTTTAATSIASSSSCYCSSSFCSSYKLNTNILPTSRSRIRVSFPQSNSLSIHHPLSTFSIGGGGRPRQSQSQLQQGSSSSRRLLVSCQVALKNSSEEEKVSKEEDEEMKRAQDKIGSRVRVKVPLKVYHVPKIPELDLTGMEGELKQYVGLWKGKRISANFPFKIQFFTRLQDRPAPVKFFVHLKEDEFDYISTTQDPSTPPPPQV